MNIKIAIADIVLEIQSNIKVKVDKTISNFVVENRIKTDEKINIVSLTDEENGCAVELHEEAGVCVYVQNRILYQEFSMKRKGIEARAVLYNVKKGQHMLKVDKIFSEMFQTEGKIYSYLGIEKILLNHQAFYLHASFVKYEDFAILFTAPSGTGKSTQASLWKKYENAEICNGDKTIVRKKGNEYWAYGSPFAGSSGIYKNEKALVKGIVVLSKAPINQITRLSGREAFIALYKQALMNTWDSKFMEKMMNLLLTVVTDIPVYHLMCKPEQEAVKLVKEALFSEGVISES